jgi:iron-sulfur cluster assembly accessory protein
MSLRELEPLFRLTPEALLKAQELQREFPRYRNLPLRLYIEGKGCDGFTYGVTFDALSPDDHVFDLEGLTCVIDPQTLVFCRDSEIHWVDDERTGFLVENPHQRHFRGKFYKRKAWVERLQGQGPSSSSL